MWSWHVKIHAISSCLTTRCCQFCLRQNTTKPWGSRCLFSWKAFEKFCQECVAKVLAHTQSPVVLWAGTCELLLIISWEDRDVCCGCAVPMQLLWGCHAVAILLQCCCYAIAMLLLCDLVLKTKTSSSAPDTCQSCNMNVLKLWHVFVKIITWNCQSCDIYFSPFTKQDQDEAWLGFSFSLIGLKNSTEFKDSINAFLVFCAFGDDHILVFLMILY